MKFTNSPFTILDKNMKALDYQKRNLSLLIEDLVTWDKKIPFLLDI